MGSCRAAGFSAKSSETLHSCRLECFAGRRRLQAAVMLLATVRWHEPSATHKNGSIAGFDGLTGQPAGALDEL
jgi:hypothetical protein